MDAKNIQKLIGGYGLMDDLLDRLQIVVNGGVARSTIYKAFQFGPQTNRTTIVLETAEKLIAEHEQKVNDALLQSTA